jgi:nickel-type superoxide dismutase maturation protease
MISRRGLLHLILLLALLAVGIEWTTRRLVVPFSVVGPSMQPTLDGGDRVLVDLWTYRHRPPRPSEIVLVRGHGEESTTLMKRVVAPPSETSGSAIWVLGDNPEASLDSRDFGAIAPERVLGRVVWRYWPLSRAGPIR